MMASRLAGLVALLPTTIFLTISFFVLVAISKVERQGIKAFGYVVAALLWLSALIVLSGGIYTLATGHRPGMCMMQGLMRSKKCPMMSGQGQMPMMHSGMEQSSPKK
jgi:hypothetical protein